MAAKTDPDGGSRRIEGVADRVILCINLIQKSRQLTIVDCTRPEVGLGPDHAVRIDPESIDPACDLPGVCDQYDPIGLGGQSPNIGGEFEVDKHPLRAVLEEPRTIFRTGIVSGNKINQGFVTNRVAAAVADRIEPWCAAINQAPGASAVEIEPAPRGRYVGPARFGL